jgi:hypothetical protein
VQSFVECKVSLADGKFKSSSVQFELKKKEKNCNFKSDSTPLVGISSYAPNTVKGRDTQY